MPCTTSKKRGEEGCGGRLLLDAGIEYLAQPASPPPPPKHSALTRFMQRIFGKDSKQIRKGEDSKRACKEDTNQKCSRDRRKGKSGKNKRSPFVFNEGEGSSCSVLTFYQEDAKGGNEGEGSSCSVPTFYQEDAKGGNKKKVNAQQENKKYLAPTCQQLICKEQNSGKHKLCKAHNTGKWLINRDISEHETARGRCKLASMSHDPFRMSEASLDVGYLPEICSSTALTNSHTCEGSCKTALTRRNAATALSGHCIQDTTTSGTSCTGKTSLQTCGGSLDTSLERLMLTQRDGVSEGAIICRASELARSVNWDQKSGDGATKPYESSSVKINETFEMENKDIVDLDSIVMQDCTEYFNRVKCLLL